jgi:LacI family transcriptional regulator
MNKRVSVIDGTGNGARHDGEHGVAQDYAHGYGHGHAPGHAHSGRPTMKDVASRARVALKTVSRVVNGEPGVTPETANRVLGAIEDLGFRRNESARLLRTGRTATLGFIADSWTDPDCAAVYRGLEDVVRSYGYLLYSGSTDGDPAREEGLALAMCARRVDGLIITPATGSHDYLVPEIEAGVTTVFVLRPPVIDRTDEVLPADAVLPDERGGGRAAVAHLIAQGHRRIGFLGSIPGNNSTSGNGSASSNSASSNSASSNSDRHRSQQLLGGYAEAIKAAGLTADPAWTTLDVSSLDRAPVTAVLCADRTRTEGALHMLAGLGRLGGDGRTAGSGRMAIVGFGDIELADLVSPGLTVVSYDPTLIGRTAGELLVRRLADDEAPHRTVEVPVRLIPRGSAEFSPDTPG